MTAPIVLARVTGLSDGDLVGATDRQRFRVMLLAADLESAGFGEPREGDEVAMRGRTYAIENPDPHTRSVAGTVMAYQVEVTG